MIQSGVSSYDFYRRLEQRFDGEIPRHLRREALAGSRNTLEAALARANSRCCDRLAVSAVRLSATRRSAAGEIEIWRRQGLAWRLIAGKSV
jgi:hypothetical protein